MKDLMDEKSAMSRRMTFTINPDSAERPLCCKISTLAASPFWTERTARISVEHLFCAYLSAASKPRPVFAPVTSMVLCAKDMAGSAGGFFTAQRSLEKPVRVWEGWLGDLWGVMVVGRDMVEMMGLWNQADLLKRFWS